MTTGLNAADTGCSARISATSAAPGDEAVLEELESDVVRARVAWRRCPSRSRPPPGTPYRRPRRRLGGARSVTAATPPISAPRSASASGCDPVVDPDPALAAVEQPGLVQHLQVVADRGLGEVEGVVEVAHARLAVVVGGDQRQQPQPDRVGQRLEQRRDPLGLLGRAAARWVRGEQQATVSTGVSSSRDFDMHQY